MGRPSSGVSTRRAASIRESGVDGVPPKRQLAAPDGGITPFLLRPEGSRLGGTPSFSKIYLCVRGTLPAFFRRRLVSHPGWDTVQHRKWRSLGGDRAEDAVNGRPTRGWDTDGHSTGNAEGAAAAHHRGLSTTPRTPKFFHPTNESHRTIQPPRASSSRPSVDAANDAGHTRARSTTEIYDGAGDKRAV